MSWIIGILTFILVINCLFMILLILVQLPKKEAGMGTAFGAGATDALFGAGTGNALTKLTKYTAVIFFVLTLGLSVLNAHQSKNKQSKLEQELNALQQQPAAPVAAPAVATNLPAPPTPAPATATATNAAPAPANPLSVTLPPTTQAPAAPATPAPPAPTPAPQNPAPQNPAPPPAPAPAPAPAPGDSPQPKP